MLREHKSQPRIVYLRKVCFKNEDENQHEVDSDSLEETNKQKDNEAVFEATGHETRKESGRERSDKTVDLNVPLLITPWRGFLAVIQRRNPGRTLCCP